MKKQPESGLTDANMSQKLSRKKCSVSIGAIVVLSLFLAAPVARALPKDICEVRAVMVSAAARERDKGVSKKRVMASIIRHMGSGFKSFSAYVDTVYANPDISPEDFYKVAYVSCLRE